MFPKSEGLGIAKDPDGRSYNMEFYGENEGAAVIVGPLRYNVGELAFQPELYREPATNADDAFAKLTAWTTANGWTKWERQTERVLWTAPPHGKPTE